MFPQCTQRGKKTIIFCRHNHSFHFELCESNSLRNGCCSFAHAVCIVFVADSLKEFGLHKGVNSLNYLYFCIFLTMLWFFFFLKANLLPQNMTQFAFANALLILLRSCFPSKIMSRPEGFVRYSTKECIGNWKQWKMDKLVLWDMYIYVYMKHSYYKKKNIFLCYVTSQNESTFSF